MYRQGQKGENDGESKDLDATGLGVKQLELVVSNIDWGIPFEHQILVFSCSLLPSKKILFPKCTLQI